ncbi:MAG TPA: BON domain-containing protein [Actinomycetota bacterium]|nr:BON domain-containing protein [Actinomycetota bacterium]
MNKRTDTERTKPKKRSILFASAVGAALAYYFDPDRGRGRRSKARDQMTAAFRRFGRRGGRLARRAESEAYGAWQRATHPLPDNPPMDDETLKQKVETELFGKPDVEKGKIVVNVEDGVVVLRGEVGSPTQMTELSQLAMEIPGVAGVQNLLHLPEEPPPNKAAAREASAQATENP